MEYSYQIFEGRNWYLCIFYNLGQKQYILFKGMFTFETEHGCSLKGNRGFTRLNELLFFLN